MLFWLIIGLFSVAAMLAVVLPVFRKSQVLDPQQQDKTVYHARLEEIDRDIDLGRITPADAEAAKAEIARKLIKSQKISEATTAVAETRSKPALVISAICIPVFSMGLYFSLGTPPSKLQPEIATISEGEQPSIETMLAAVEKRLEQQPDDARGWAVVAPVYERMGRYDDAIKAYENLIRLSGRKPEFVFGIGEALMSKANGRVTPDALELFRETLDLDPRNAVAGFYIGAHAMQQGNNEKAIAIWQEIADNASGNEDWLPTIRSRIAELKAQTKNAARSQAEQEVEMIGAMVSRLEERLEQNPDDKEGWEMLIRSYVVMERDDDALAIIRQAKNRFSDDPEFVRKLDERQTAIENADTNRNAQ